MTKLGLLLWPNWDFRPLAYFSDLIANCLGDIGEKLICCITCPVATCLALTMIAIGWIAYRPIIAIPFLIVALLCCGGGGYSIYKVKYMDEETKVRQHRQLLWRHFSRGSLRCAKPHAPGDMLFFVPMFVGC